MVNLSKPLESKHVPLSSSQIILSNDQELISKEYTDTWQFACMKIRGRIEVILPLHGHSDREDSNKQNYHQLTYTTVVPAEATITGVCETGTGIPKLLDIRWNLKESSGTKDLDINDYQMQFYFVTTNETYSLERIVFKQPSHGLRESKYNLIEAGIHNASSLMPM
jgi:hypothetical protein